MKLELLCEWRQRWFHGTTINRLSAILGSGLYPETKNKNSGTMDYVYLAANPATANLYGFEPPGDIGNRDHTNKRWSGDRYNDDKDYEWVLVEVVADTRSGSGDEDNWDMIMGELDLNDLSNIEEWFNENKIPEIYRAQFVKMLKDWVAMQGGEIVGGYNYSDSEFLAYMDPIIKKIGVLIDKNDIGRGSSGNMRIDRLIGYKGKEKIIAIYVMKYGDKNEAVVSEVIYSDEHIKPSYKIGDHISIAHEYAW